MSVGRIAVRLLLLAGFLGVLSEGWAVPPAGAQAPPSVSLRPPSTRIAYDDGRFTMRVELSGFEHHGQIQYDDDRDKKPDRIERSDGMGAYELYLYYDPGVVRVTGWDPGDFLRRGRSSVQCLDRSDEPGLYVMGCVSMGSGAGPQGSGLLGTVRLEPLANGITTIQVESEFAGPLGDAVPTVFSQTRIEVFGAPEVAPPPPPNRPPPPTCNDCVWDDDGSLVSGNPTSPRSSVRGATNPGSTNGSNQPGGGLSTTGADGAVSGGADNPSSGPGAFGRAGTGYQPSSGSWPVALVGLLVLAGLTFLLAGSRTHAGNPRS